MSKHFVQEKTRANKLFTYWCLMLVLCSFVCIMAGCKSQNGIHYPGSSETDNENMSKCANGSKFVQRHCVCDDGTEWLGRGWYCIFKGERCYDNEGCADGDNIYPKGTDYAYGDFSEQPMNKDYDGFPEENIEYICVDDTWILRSEVWDVDWNEFPNYYCDGIPLSALSKDHKAETLDYICRYKHWVCDSDKGCDCFDGYDNHSIQRGEVCDNRVCKSNLSDRVTETYSTPASIIYQCSGSKQRRCDDESPKWLPSGLCLDGNCPCGDGYCMKFGVCTDGVCTCHDLKTNLHGEFYCNLYSIVYAGDPYDCGVDDRYDDVGGILSCEKEGGCYTSDGRHYPRNATIGFNGFDIIHGDERKMQAFIRERNYQENLYFHIDAGFDTTIESISELGECVLDRTDSIPRWSDITNHDSANSEYICDKRTCKCGADTCRIGEICRSGRCVSDTCQAHGATRAICEVDIHNGERSFVSEKIPGACIDIQAVEKLRERIAEDAYQKYTHGERQIHYMYGDREIHEWELDDVEGYSFSIPDSLNIIDMFLKIMNITDLREGNKYYDVAECKGGHRYCHGVNNDPIRISDNPKGWACKTVESLYGIGKKTGLKAWVCDDKDGCICGNTPCGYLKSCIDGQCHDVSLPVEYCDGKPLEAGYECSYFCSHTGTEECVDDGMKCVERECACGESVCKYGEMCRNGRCLVIKDDEPYTVGPGNDCVIHTTSNSAKCTCYGDGKLDENGCWCGEVKLKNAQETCLHIHDQYYVLCNDSEGCSCGDTKCPMSSYCSDNQCIDPLTGKPVPESSEKLGLATSCVKETCKCGDSVCHQGQFCYGSECHNKVYANVLHGERYFYDDRLNYSDVYHKHYLNWELIQSYDMSEYNPNHLPLDEYAFYPYYDVTDENCIGVPPAETFRKEPLRCMIASGCQCGDSYCPWGAECINGACRYDNRYFTRFYNVSVGSYDVFGKGKLIYCNGTSIIPKKPIFQYETEEYDPEVEYDSDYRCDDYGWKCLNETGCECGDKICSYSAFCIQPGLCTEYYKDNE